MNTSNCMDEFSSKNIKLRTNFLTCKSVRTQRSTVRKETFEILKYIKNDSFSF